MSEPNHDNCFEVKCLKENTAITITVTDHLHERLQNLLLSGIAFKDIETMQKTLAHLQNSADDPDPATYHARTIITLIGLIEEAAQKEDKIESKFIDKTTRKPV